MSKDREFYMRRLHSLLGIIPVGLFLTQHLVVNHFATRGEEAFNNATHFMESLPFVLLLEIFVIYIPLLFHAFYGIYIAFTVKYNPNRYGTFRNWLFILQRFTGIFLVVFIASVRLPPSIWTSCPTCANTTAIPVSLINHST